MAKLDPGGTFLWVASANTSSEQGSKCGVGLDGKGNVYVMGQFRHKAVFGSTTLSLPGKNTNGLFVARLDSTGELQWATPMSTDSKEPIHGWDLAVDSQGNSHVTGSYQGSAVIGTTSLKAQKGADVFVTKVGPAGKVLWAASPGGDAGMGVAVDSAGNSYVTGHYTDQMTFVTTTLSSTKVQRVFVTKMDKGGNYLWAASAGGNASTGGTDVAVDSSGNSLVTGYFYGQLGGSATFGNTTLVCKGSDMFVWKLDRDGK